MVNPQDDQPSLPPMDEAQRQMLTAASDAMAQIAELVVGYRRRLADGGVGDDIADQMTKDMHDMMLAQINVASAAQTIKGAFQKGRR